MSENKKVLVTGADGFIGSHLTESLVRDGFDVRAFVFYNSFNSWGWLDHSGKDILSSLEVFEGDIRDPNGVRKAMAGCSTVFHLAALISIPYSYHSPDAYVDTNIKGTLNVVQAARDLGTQRIVHTSTSEVYGTALYVPINEDHPLQGQSPYSASKIGADQISLSFFRSFGTPISVIRPFNTYGPRQSLRAVIPTIISQIASGNKEIKLGSTHPTRDFNFIEDTVKGFKAIAASENTVGEVVNIGSNYEISIAKLIALISGLMGAKVRIASDSARIRPEKSEVERLWADNAKAKALAGWEPSYSGLKGLKKGLAKTIEWYTEPENLKRFKADRYNI